MFPGAPLPPLFSVLTGYGDTLRPPPTLAQHGTRTAPHCRALLDTAGAAADVHAPRARRPCRCCRPCRRLVGWCPAAGLCRRHPAAAVREAAGLQAEHGPGLPHRLLRAAGVRRRDRAEAHQPGSRGRSPQLATPLSCTPTLHPCGTRLSYTCWPDPMATPPQLMYATSLAPAGRLPQLLRLRARQEPGGLRTRHQGVRRRRPVTTVYPARPARRACWPCRTAQAPHEPPRSPRSVRTPSRRRSRLPSALLTCTARSPA
eukprot:scaffold48416_cov56-Phaeocystis_antarctica.AAC.1